MSGTATLITTVVGISILLFFVAVVLVAFGYWMGRNSMERPFRSLHNPARAKPTAPIDEPAGDLFNDAAWGTPGTDDTTRIPTIGGER